MVGRWDLGVRLPVAAVCLRAVRQLPQAAGWVQPSAAPLRSTFDTHRYAARWYRAAGMVSGWGNVKKLQPMTYGWMDQAGSHFWKSHYRFQCTDWKFAWECWMKSKTPQASLPARTLTPPKFYIFPFTPCTPGWGLIHYICSFLPLTVSSFYLLSI